MSKQKIKPSLVSLTCLVFISLIGCSEGVLWKTGNWSPWARQKWAEEEQIAQSLFAQREEMNAMVDAVTGGKVAQGQIDRVAQHLSGIVRNDSIKLSRLHAVNLLSRINSSIAAETLREASQDRDTEVRIAAVNALGKSGMASSVTTLQEVLNSDTNNDVRMAATRALGSTSGTQSLQALAGVLEDKDPALQVSATESLARITGQKLGADVFAWQEYLGNTTGNTIENGPVSQAPTNTAAAPDNSDQGSDTRWR